MGKNIIIGFVISVIAVGALSFYGGMKYQQMQRGNFRQNGGQFGNGGMMGGSNGTNRPRGMGGNQVTGEILSQDEKSITVKLPDGSSKIVLVSEKTTVNKATEGSKTDLVTGEKVRIFGSDNPDGSVNAQNIQINPPMVNPTQGK